MHRFPQGPKTMENHSDHGGLTVPGRLLALTANVMKDTGAEEEALEYVRA